MPRVAGGSSVSPIAHVLPWRCTAAGRRVEKPPDLPFVTAPPVCGVPLAGDDGPGSNCAGASRISGPRLAEPTLRSTAPAVRHPGLLSGAKAGRTLRRGPLVRRFAIFPVDARRRQRVPDGLSQKPYQHGGRAAP
jgi:hypothetical protein